ncbi:cell division protein FtsI [Frondihabitans sucicola]|uniref:Cell division protein FtsI n=1 Tax=Frondihabitans sucicola TaxID=1268041 RepID=A0ABN6Y361_9MICO|nr:penicillin-binding protein 2 [Frondihabitans sucicola]BDZ50433.1 cell division protein FtsI [Frondihabitans sucicola]
MRATGYPSVRGRRRRATVAAIAIFALVAIFVVRLVDIQVVQAATLNADAVGKRSISTTIYGDRGKIVDTNGKVLAGTVLRYDITAVPKFAQAGYTTTDAKGVKHTFTLQQAAQQIASATGVKVSTILSGLTGDKESLYVKLVSAVDVDAYDKITKLGISWLYPQRTTARTYPDGAVAGNLVGFVGTDGAQAGLELEYNSCLAGKNGSQTYERGADGVKLPGSTVTKKEAVDGGTLETTIDSDLQYQMQQDLNEQVQAIGATSGTVVVMKVSDGSLLAVADSGSVDPNDVNASKGKNLESRAFQASYEPGSTFKAMTAATAIDLGAASPASQEVVADTRNFSWGGMIGDAEAHPVEHLTLAGILADSSNVGISYIGQKVTKQQRYDYMLKFGLGRTSEVNFPGESVGQLRPASKWDSQTDINSMFGQGVGATAIQTASIYQTIANGGVRMPVKLVKGCVGSDGKVTDAPSDKGTRVVSQKAANDVVDMLENTIPEGTLKGMTPISGYNVAAKTGTAQIADGPGGTYGSDYIISVAGIAPAENPQYVVLVTFNKPTTLKTSFAAAPAFREIMSQVLENYRVKPSTTAPTHLPDTW